jgi:histidinol-phosphate aminotransferase
MKEMKKISMIEKYTVPPESNYAKLDANENLVIDKEYLTKIALDNLRKIDLRKYPIGLYEQLYRRLSQHLKISERSLVVGSGSDQIIDLLLTLIGNGRRMTSIYPTFSYFKTRCQLHGIAFSEISLSSIDNSLDIDEFIADAKKSHAIYLCSPNNPTGNQFVKSDILHILDTLKNNLVIIDEAYVEFSKYSLTKYVKQYPNLVILRTFSKALGLAAVRVGYMIANEQLAELFRYRIQLPYAVNSISLSIAMSLISRPKKIQESISLIKHERERLYHALSKIKSIDVYSSDANFLFIKCNTKYSRIMKALDNSKIIVKGLGNIKNYGNCVRITVGTKKMNNKILSALKDIH